jgi:hypothetical protein
MSDVEAYLVFVYALFQCREWTGQLFVIYRPNNSEHTIM